MMGGTDASCANLPRCEINPLETVLTWGSERNVLALRGETQHDMFHSLCVPAATKTRSTVEVWNTNGRKLPEGPCVPYSPEEAWGYRHQRKAKKGRVHEAENQYAAPASAGWPPTYLPTISRTSGS